MSAGTPRRAFFRQSVDELIAAVEQYRGRPSFKLSLLGGLSDGELGGLIPAIQDVSPVRAVGDSFVLDGPGGSEPLFAIGSREEDVWCRMDGRATLRQIADALALEWNESRAVAFATTRSLFLKLAGRQLCLPLNPLE